MGKEAGITCQSEVCDGNYVILSASRVVPTNLLLLLKKTKKRPMSSNYQRAGDNPFFSCNHESRN